MPMLLKDISPDLIDYRVDVEGGKYSVVYFKNQTFVAYRHGAEWSARNLTGDKLIHALVFELAEAKAALARVRETDIVFDGPPEHEAGRFVEVECPPGTSVRVGEWVKRPDGFWALRLRCQVE